MTTWSSVTPWSLPAVASPSPQGESRVPNTSVAGPSADSVVAEPSPDPPFADASSSRSVLHAPTTAISTASPPMRRNEVLRNVLPPCSTGSLRGTPRI